VHRIVLKTTAYSVMLLKVTYFLFLIPNSIKHDFSAKFDLHTLTSGS